LSIVGVGSVVGLECVASNLFHAYMSRLQPMDAAARWQRIEARSVALKNGWSMMQLLRARVDKHVRTRCEAGRRHLEAMCNDTLSLVVRHLSPKSASSLMRTCKMFKGLDRLQNQMPHLRIRHVPVAFPHARQASRDRADLARNVNRPVMRNFVVTRNAVRLFVDFIVPTLRTTPLVKLPRTDGLCNKMADFSDDEFEEAPERRYRAGLPITKIPIYHEPDSQWARRHRAREQRRRRAWDVANGPPEKVDRLVYDRRIPYSAFFQAPLVMTPSLVFADDLSPVPCAQHKGGLALCAEMRSHGGAFWQPRTGEVAYEADYQTPASARFHVPHLSRDHTDRLFKIKVVATGLLLDGTPFERAIYSDPFESVGKIQAVQKATKRGAAVAPRAHKVQRH